MAISGCCSAGGAVLDNPDFETGDLSGWTSVARPLTVGIDTNNTFNRNNSARIHGAYSSAPLITNSIWQTLDANAGDNVQALGFVHWKTHERASAGATGYVQATLSGPFSTASRVWTATNSWCFFDLAGKIFGVADSGFESGALDIGRMVRRPHCQVQGSVVDSGNYSLKMSGAWSNKWSLERGIPVCRPSSGDVVQAARA